MTLGSLFNGSGGVDYNGEKEKSHETSQNH